MEIGFSDRDCLICHQPLSDAELRKAKVLPIGAGLGLTMHKECAEQWALDLENQGKEKLFKDAQPRIIREVVEKLKQEPMKKSYNPYDVKQQFGTLEMENNQYDD